MTENELREHLAEYLTTLQSHPSAEEMMAAVLTDDFETGFVDGFTWKGIDGLRASSRSGTASSTGAYAGRRTAGAWQRRWSSASRT
jgi:hypothetical protein